MPILCKMLLIQHSWSSNNATFLTYDTSLSLRRPWRMTSCALWHRIVGQIHTLLRRSRCFVLLFESSILNMNAVWISEILVTIYTRMHGDISYKPVTLVSKTVIANKTSMIFSSLECPFFCEDQWEVNRNVCTWLPNRTGMIMYFVSYSSQYMTMLHYWT